MGALVLVTGAAGRKPGSTGRWVAGLLLDRGVPVHAFARTQDHRAARPTCHLPRSVSMVASPLLPTWASKLCRWLPVAVCPDSLTAGWNRGGVAPVGADEPQCPAAGGDPGVDDAAVGCEARLGGAVVGG